MLFVGGAVAGVPGLALVLPPWAWHGVGAALSAILTDRRLRARHLYARRCRRSRLQRISRNPSTKIQRGRIETPPLRAFGSFIHHAAFSARATGRVIATVLLVLNALFGADPAVLRCPEARDSDRSGASAACAGALFIAEAWISCNSAWMALTQRTFWDVQGIEGLDYRSCTS